jgi:hypothetical protein
MLYPFNPSLNPFPGTIPSYGAPAPLPVAGIQPQSLATTLGYPAPVMISPGTSAAAIAGADQWQPRTVYAATPSIATLPVLTANPFVLTNALTAFPSGVQQPSQMAPTEAPQEQPWVTLPNGLQYKDLEVGPGPVAQDGQTLAIEYTGTLAENGKKFDSTSDHGGEPFEFKLGAHDVIAGMDQGVQGMRVGGHRLVRIPSRLGYGKAGAGDDIPPNADLQFDIRLLATR